MLYAAFVSELLLGNASVADVCVCVCVFVGHLTVAAMWRAVSYKWKFNTTANGPTAIFFFSFFFFYLVGLVAHCSFVKTRYCEEKEKCSDRQTESDGQLLQIDWDTIQIVFSGVLSKGNRLSKIIDVSLQIPSCTLHQVYILSAFTVN